MPMLNDKFCLVLLLITSELIGKISNSSQRKCRRSENCECFNHSDHYEYQCGEQNVETILHVYPNSSIRLDCNNLQVLDIGRSVPNLTFENIDKFQVRYCPLPRNGISAIVRRLGVLELDFLSFEFGIFPDKALRKADFEGMTTLKVLRLRGNQLERIERDFFGNFPKLLSLELDRNRLTLEEFDAPNLKFLSLSDNNLNSFPNQTNLANLERLNLWKNDLKTFDGSKFPNLRSLELAYNKISTIDLGLSPKLVNVSLRSNSIEKLNWTNVRSNDNLESFEIGGNSNLSLDGGVFSNLRSLRRVDLSNAKLVAIPEDAFENSTNLNAIALDRNELERLPEKLFDGLGKLKSLAVSFNRISRLNDSLFASLIRLERLDLKHNRIEEISENLFKSLTSLRELDLSYNDIGTVRVAAFDRLRKLIKLSLSHNRFLYKDSETFPSTPFNNCKELEEIDLSHNRVLDFPEHLMWTASIRTIDLSWNNITQLRVNSLWKVALNEVQINLEHNRISRFNFDDVELTAMNQPDLDAYHNNYGASTVVRISGNPLICDCFAIDLVRYVRNSMYPGVKTAIFFLYNNLTCASPAVFENVNVTLVRPQLLTCPIGDVVPRFDSCVRTDRDDRDCDCYWRPFDRSVLVDCSNRNLSSFPAIIHPERLVFDQTIVDLSGNSLRMLDGDAASLGYENVSELHLQNNEIDLVSWVPSKLRVLDLSRNKIPKLGHDVLRRLNSSNVLSRLSLQRNPWKCDCSASNFSSFLRQNVYKLDANGQELYCREDTAVTLRLINLTERDLCPHNFALLMGTTTVFVLVLCIFTTLAALYYKYQREIKVWMYAHNVFLFLIREEELDRDKLYDAFISYSHKDEDFVIENLVQVLESGPRPYKLCLHFRNWIPGEFIATQVTSSVQNSRRTLVVLTPNFLESVWGKMEFRTAHTEAMKEGRARVIIVLHGDVDMDCLDDELKAYMKTNTYVKWGDPWFWDKLKYALPHTRIEGAGDTAAIQKHANMMKYIDDKFSMISKDGKTLSDRAVGNVNEENTLMTIDAVK